MPSGLSGSRADEKCICVCPESNYCPLRIVSFLVNKVSGLRVGDLSNGRYLQLLLLTEEFGVDLDSVL